MALMPDGDVGASRHPEHSGPLGAGVGQSGARRLTFGSAVAVLSRRHPGRDPLRVGILAR